MARKKSYDLPESEPVSEDPPATDESNWPLKEATITVTRHMELDGVTGWHTVVVQVSANVNPDNPSEFQNLSVTAEKVEGISLNESETEVAHQALGIEPVEDTMTEEEHDKALEEELGEEEPEEA